MANLIQATSSKLRFNLRQYEGGAITEEQSKRNFDQIFVSAVRNFLSQDDIVYLACMCVSTSILMAIQQAIDTGVDL